MHSVISVIEPILDTMIRLLYIFIISFILSAPMNAQVPDFISVKRKNGRTIRNYYAGGWPINFKTTNGSVYEGPIDKIANDSLWIKFYNIRRIPTIWNTFLYDTLEVYTVPFHYKEIDYIIFPSTRKSKHNLALLGSMMQIGGFGYDVVNIVNSIYLQDSFTSKRNLKNVGIATTVGLAGTLIKRKFGNPYRKSRRYKIVYINMQ
ncbi:MAG: hypothetical protein ACK5NK_08220 [Niabella sp.]